MSRETWHLRTTALRERFVNLLMRSPLYDEKTRVLVVDVYRENSEIGASKKRLFHAYVNVLADYKDVPPKAMKATLKAMCFPLVEETNLITGEVSWPPKRTRDLADDEAAIVCEKVVKLAGDEWELPLPATEPEWDIVKVGGLEALMAYREIAKAQEGP